MTAPVDAPPARAHWLECKVPPPVVDALCAALMWLAARATPALQWGLEASWRSAALRVLCVLGVGVAVSGLLAVARARSSLNPLRPQDARTLVQGGVYRFTRNPMYLGMALVLLGWACWLAHPLALLAWAAGAAWIQRFQMLPEERALRARFGAAYAAYCQRTRRWL